MSVPSRRGSPGGAGGGTHRGADRARCRGGVHVRADADGRVRGLLAEAGLAPRLEFILDDTAARIVLTTSQVLPINSLGQNVSVSASPVSRRFSQ